MIVDDEYHSGTPIFDFNSSDITIIPNDSKSSDICNNEVKLVDNEKNSHPRAVKKENLHRLAHDKKFYHKSQCIKEFITNESSRIKVNNDRLYLTAQNRYDIEGLKHANTSELNKKLFKHGLLS